MRFQFNQSLLKPIKLSAWVPIVAFWQVWKEKLDESRFGRLLLRERGPGLAADFRPTTHLLQRQIPTSGALPMPMIIWPIFWILFIVGLWVAFGVAALKEAKIRKRAAQEQLARQQAMSGVGMEMEGSAAAPAEAGFDDGFGQSDEFAQFDENAFK